MSTAAMTTARQQTAVATTATNANEKSVLPTTELRRLLNAKLDLVRDALPHAMQNAAPRYAVALVGMCQNDPKLAACTAFSLLSGMLKAANHGLELGPPLNQCYLIPRWNKNLGVSEATFQLGYPGVAALISRHPSVASITWNIVRKNDEFEEIGGSDPKINHKAARGNRGEVEAYYCQIKLRSGHGVHKVMTVEEVDEHRKKFSEFGTNRDGSRAGNWLKNFDAMALKTVLLQAGKTAPKAVEFPDFRRIEEGPPPQTEQVSAIVQHAEPVKQLAEGDKPEVSLEDLDTAARVVAQAEGMEPCDVEFETAQKFGAQVFDALTPEQRVEAHAALNERAAK